MSGAGPAWGTISLIARRSESGVAESRFAGALPHGMADNVNHLNAQTHVCPCQLRLHCFPGCETLPQVIRGNCIE